MITSRLQCHRLHIEIIPTHGAICILGKGHKWALEAEARLPEEERLQTNEPSMY